MKTCNLCSPSHRVFTWTSEHFLFHSQFQLVDIFALLFHVKMSNRTVVFFSGYSVGSIECSDIISNLIATGERNKRQDWWYPWLHHEES